MSNRVQDRIAEMKRSREEGEYINPIFNKTFKDIIKDNDRDIEKIPIDKLTPAPNDWNIYPPISEDKMLEMIFSIMENGLFNPIIVWQLGEEYMILSGHNRTRAYKIILNEYSDAENFVREDFESIPAIVFKEDELDDMKAKEIIIDSNYIQREEDKSLTPRIIKERIEIVKSRKDFKGRPITAVAEEMDLSIAKVSEDYLIATDLIPVAQDMYFKGRLTKKGVLRLAWLEPELQEWIINEYGDDLTSKMLLTIEKDFNKKDIIVAFKEVLEGPEVTNVTTKVPKDLVEEFREMVNIWLINKEKENM